MQMKGWRPDANEVPYLPEKWIERDAAALLAEFEQARGVQTGPPVPIEEIIKKHLKLGLEFEDVDKLYGILCFAPRFVF